MQVIEAPCPNGVASEAEPPSTTTYAQSSSTTEAKDTSESYGSQKVPLKAPGGAVMNHEDTLEVRRSNAAARRLTGELQG